MKFEVKSLSHFPGSFEFDVEDDLPDDVELNSDYVDTINKIRKIARMFRNSPTKMDSLRKILKERWPRVLKEMLKKKTKALKEMLKKDIKDVK